MFAHIYLDTFDFIHGHTDVLLDNYVQIKFS